MSFQQTLEEGYGRAAREKKRNVWRKEKGAKGFNGLYKKDQASSESWVSLPSGPDPHSVALLDIHEHLPTLTRTYFFHPSVVFR